MKHLSLLLVVFITHLSCRTSVDNDKAHGFYFIVKSSFDYTNGVQIRFMKKLMQEVKQVNSTDVINTTELKSLLDSSKEAIELKDAIIKNVEEVDETIALKQKVTNFNSLARDLFTQDFPAIISIMDLKTDRRAKLSEVIKVLEPKLNDISESASSCEKAGEEFRTKYEIELVDEAGK